MKSDTEIIEYLLPYTKQEGTFYPKKVVIKLYSYDIFKGMLIHFDLRSTFSNNKKNTLTSMLRRNGFRYIPNLDGYYRLMSEKDNIVLDGAMIMDNDFVLL